MLRIHRFVDFLESKSYVFIYHNKFSIIRCSVQVVCKSVARKYIRYKNKKGTKYRFTIHVRVKFVKMYMILPKKKKKERTHVSQLIRNMNCIVTIIYRTPLYISKTLRFRLIFVRTLFADYPVQMAWTSRNFYELYKYIYMDTYIGAYDRMYCK